MALPAVLAAADILGPAGPFAAIFSSFEWRHGQQEMAAAVARTLNQSGVALIEAGTGTGKSLAYLVPAALYALHTGNKVVISTNTIHLQEQLLHKDIPLVQKALLPELRACLVKGWRNYLCLYRLSQMVPEGLEQGETHQLQELGVWATECTEGSLAELGREPSIWDDVCAESDTCLHANCPFHQRCFFLRARAAMEDAQLLVVNHHLLFADVAVRRAIGWDTERGVLPHYSHVILDEAHHVEHVATDFLGSALSEYAINRLVRRLDNFAGGQTRGALAQVADLATHCIMQGKNIERAEQVLSIIEFTAKPAVEQLAQSGQQLFAKVAEWLKQDGHTVGRIRAGHDQEQWRSNVSPQAEAFAATAKDMAETLCKLKDEAAPLMADEPGLQCELEALATRCHNHADLAEMLGAATDEEQVFWVDSTGQREQVRALATPLAVGPTVRAWVDTLDTLICTSATLTVAGSFAYVEERMGLQDLPEPCAELIIPSPFNYKDQALLGVTTDLPEPTAASYPDALAAAVQELVVASRGRAFVLFTSYALLRQVAIRLAPVCKQEGWPLLVQGQAARSRLLTAFRNTDSVLLGTDSFWEGVDVPGEALSCVILTRLPFRVPDNPVMEARTEAMRKQGLDPFYNYSMPEAVLKFKQGFGRLIRSRSDKGAVVVCDKRILGRGYGRYFLASLPECTALSGSLAEISTALRAWV